MSPEELRAALAESRAAFLQAIEGLSAEEMLEPGAAGEWSVRDVMQHLSIWEAETIQLIVHSRRGHRPPSERFQTSPDALDVKLHDATRTRPLERVLEDFHGVRRQLLRHLKDLTALELNRVSALPWMEKRPLADWIARDTYLREQGQMGSIRRWRAARSEGTRRSEAAPNSASPLGGSHD